MVPGRSVQNGKRSGVKRRAKNAVCAAPESNDWIAPVASGLFDPAHEKDSCGVGFIADIKGKKSHQIVEDGLTILSNLEHRGAVGADPRAGDGAGILVQIPHKFFLKETKKLGFQLPEPGQYAVGFFVHAERCGLAKTNSGNLRGAGRVGRNESARMA